MNDAIIQLTFLFSHCSFSWWGGRGSLHTACIRAGKNIYMYMPQQYLAILYSGKLLREKTSVNIMVLGVSMKVFTVKFLGCGLYNWWH